MKENRLYGLMIGITVGFAAWGSIKIVPKQESSTAANTYNTACSASYCTSYNTNHSTSYNASCSTSYNNTSCNNTSYSTSYSTYIEENDIQENYVEDYIEENYIEENGAEEKAKEENEPKLHALSAVLMDGDSGRILYEKEGNAFRPMASTTKIMTCILALENGSLSDVCTVSPNAASQPKVHLGAGAGMKFYLKDLLYSLMLESHNDTAVVIAEQIGGSTEGFAAMMNQKALDLGCKDTFFITPNGLDAVRTDRNGTERMHGTTAEDLARIMRYCVWESPKREEFLEITRTSNYSFMDTERKHSFSCVNHNALLNILEGAVSGKTGFTGGAGYSYVGAYQNDGRNFVAVLLGCGWPPHKTWKWEDAKALFQYGRENFYYRDVYQEPDLRPVPVADGAEEDGGEAKLHLTANVSEEDRHLKLLLKEGEEVSCKIELPARVEAPVARGEIIGRWMYELDGEIVRSYPIYAAETIRRRDFRYCLGKIWKLWSLPAETVN